MYRHGESRHEDDAAERGAGLNTGLVKMGTFLVVLLLLLLIGGGAAYFFREELGIGDKIPMPKRSAKRTGVIETVRMDAKRKLVLVRRDDVEHLIMTGGPIDVVVETRIARTRAPGYTPARPSQFDADGHDPDRVVFGRAPKVEAGE